MSRSAFEASAASDPLGAEIVVIGSGAGGAVTAAVLAEAGHEVVLLEEGPAVDTSSMSSNTPEAMLALYRNAGLTPILGNQNIAFVEGRCVGGSTEVNSGFWHRIPDDCYHRWKADFLVDALSQETLEEGFDRIERELSVARIGKQGESRASELFRRGAEALGWHCEEVPRCQKAPGTSAFAPGAKQSMQRTYLPRAERAGARLLAGFRVRRIELSGSRATGVVALQQEGKRVVERRIRADAIFSCCGAIQTPALLRRSGIRKNVGNSLRIHPMIKAAAFFGDDVEALDASIPMYQVKDFRPAITIGGSVGSPGFLAMLLGDNWESHRDLMQSWNHTSLFYAATRGLNHGTVRSLPGANGGVLVRYRLSRADRRNLSFGLGRLGELLFAAGAKAVVPSLRSFPALRSPEQCRSFLVDHVPLSAMSLSTVHAFSTCPMGENPDLCATDSFGAVSGVEGLYVNDASLIPDSPGVNPQGTTMAIALRNAEHFIDRPRRSSRSPSRRTPGERADVLVTGAPGWIGTRLVETLCGDSDLPLETPERLRCLVQPQVDDATLRALSSRVSTTDGDLRDPSSLRAFCAGAEGATLYHAAGVIHPRRTRDFDEVNVEGTRSLLATAREAGVRRVVVISSNSPMGANAATEDVFDEDSPYRPYMGYGRSKVGMERVVAEFQAGGDIETAVVRAPWFYGPYQPPRQTLFFRMIKEGRFPLLGDGRQKRSMVYVDNLCQGLLLAGSVAEARGQTFWIADERPYPLIEILETVEDVLECDFGIACARRRPHLPARVGDVARWLDAGIQSLGLYEQRIHVLGEMNQTIACSIDKAKAVLGYLPRFSLREGMAESVRWCLAHGQYI